MCTTFHVSMGPVELANFSDEHAHAVWLIPMTTCGQTKSHNTLQGAVTYEAVYTSNKCVAKLSHVIIF